MHLLLIGLVMRIPPRRVEDAKSKKIMVILGQQPTALVPMDVPLMFQKPGPDTGDRQSGLPPASTEREEAPDGSLAQPAPAEEEPARGEAQARPEKTQRSEPEEEEEVSQPRLQVPSESEATVPPSAAPFARSLDEIGKAGPPAGSASGTGRGRTAAPPGPFGDLAGGDASFAFDSGGFDLSEWAELVKQKVRSNWVIPTAALMGMKGVVSISLVVERDGTISYAEVVTSASVVSLDSAALNALKSSNPLPPLPSGFPKANLPGRFTFYYNVYPRS